MLRAERLRKAFVSGGDGVQAVNRISLSVKAGEFFTLLGPSGCGKTTTLRCIAGLESPDEGEIWIDGELVFSSQKRIFVPTHRRAIGMVFQSYAIWPHMTVAENVAYPLTHGRGKVPSLEVTRRVKDVLNLVQLDGFANRPAPLLSGGQQQRVALARALVGEPKLLLLDEPLSNLDAKLRIEMRQELKLLFEKLKVTGLYVTHDQEEALVLSDRIAVMNRGEVMQVGPPVEIYKEPANLFTAAFVGTTNLFQGRVLRKRNAYEYGLVDTPVGKISCSIPENTKEDQAVNIVFRPDAVRVHVDLCMSLKNVLAGTIENIIFTGNRLDYTVKVQNAFINVQTSPYFEDLCKGQSVRIEIPVDRIRVLPS